MSPRGAIETKLDDITSTLSSITSMQCTIPLGLPLNFYANPQGRLFGVALFLSQKIETSYIMAVRTPSVSRSVLQSPPCKSSPRLRNPVTHYPPNRNQLYRGCPHQKHVCLIYLRHCVTPLRTRFLIQTNTLHVKKVTDGTKVTKEGL